MLQIHNLDWVWLQFAKYEFEHKGSSETARKIFLKCLNFHSESRNVWLEYFKFELIYVVRIKKRYEILANKSSKQT